MREMASAGRNEKFHVASANVDADFRSMEYKRARHRSY